MGVLDVTTAASPTSGFSLDNHKFQQVFRNGDFGTVALYETQDNEVVFVKIMKRSALNYKREDAIVKHSTLMSPYVVMQREVVVRKDGVVRVVMDFCSGGSLEALVRSSPGGRLSESQALPLFQQLIKAVDYTLRMGVTDRDLKLSNTLLQPKPDGSLQLKVSDFGYGIHDSQDMKRRAEALAYVAPEVMDSEEYEDELKDMWQCGVMLFAMLFGKYPVPCGAHLGRLNSEEMLELHAREVASGLTLPSDVSVSGACADLLQRMLAPAPEDRARLADVMAHSWFRQGLVEDDSATAAEEPALPMKKRQSVQDIKQLLDFALA